ncbi:MAG: hypothetical protein Q9196_004907 [Gyalolechia fulgens]
MAILKALLKTVIRKCLWKKIHASTIQTFQNLTSVHRHHLTPLGLPLIWRMEAKAIIRKITRLDSLEVVMDLLMHRAGETHKRPVRGGASVGVVHCKEASLAEQHDPQKLRTFATNRVNRWLDNHMTVDLTWGYFRNIKCDVTEIEPNGPSLLLKNQYRLNLETNQYDLFQARKLVHQSLKLVVITHIMTHSMTLVESTKDQVYDRLRNPPPERYGQQTSPRWLNKQIKFLLCALHQDILRDVLSQIQETLRLSGKKATWAALFASMTILAMTTESLQVAVRCKDETDKGEGTVRQNDTTADEAIKLMDERFELLKNLFHQGHRTLSSKGLNPIRKVQDRTFLDGASQSLASKASEIIDSYYEFLVARHVLTPPTKASEPQTARLIARFLLCFSPPVEQHHHQPADPASS